jgi:hypothetical protein
VICAVHAGTGRLLPAAPTTEGTSSSRRVEGLLLWAGAELDGIGLSERVEELTGEELAKFGSLQI